MILSRFFKPKWQHPDPQIRKQCVQTLAARDPVLTQIACEDREPSVRCSAIARITDMGLLQRIAERDSQALVRDSATVRLQELISGRAADSPPLEARMAALGSLGPRFMEYLVLQGSEPELRQAVLAHVEEVSLLVQVVSNDPVVQLRLVALEKIADSASLEQLFKSLRNRDKRLSRRVRERLDALLEAQQRAERIDGLYAEMETLVWDGEEGINAAKYPKIEREWQKLEAYAGAAVVDRYHRARTRYLEQRQQSIARRTARQQLCAELEELLATVQSSGELTPELAKRIDGILRDTAGRWRQQGTADSAEERRLEQRFAQSTQAIKERERLLQRNRERAQRLREILQQADTLLDQPSEVLESDLSTLKQRWSSMERPEFRELAQALQAQFDAVLGKLRHRLQLQVERRDRELAEIEDLVRQLEDALETGELQQAIAIHGQARERLRHNISLSRRQMMALEERLQACLPKLGELRDWRRWGVNQVRAQLCEEAENLLGVELDPPEIARRIKNLRATWKELNGNEGDALAKSLWKRFDKACEKAYQPCKAYFDERAREREENLSSSTALCERLERFVADTDWERVDWPAADRLRRQVQSRWQKLGAVPKAQKTAIERRFGAALRRLDSYLLPERDRELRRRQGLIERLQALAGGEDLRAAVAAVKQAQAEWHPSVRGTQAEEQALWRRFREVCDAVFERRKTQQQEAEEQRQANLQGKTALCEELEALSGGDGEALARARQRVDEIKQQWATIGPVPRAVYRDLEQRFDSAVKAFTRHERQRRASGLLQELQGLGRRASLCGRIEALLEQEGGEMARTAVEDAQREWASLGCLSSASLEAVERRFAAACRALLEGGDAQRTLRDDLRGNLEKKQALCLRLEILAGVESPDEFAQDRMRHQVDRLSESLAGGVALASVEEARAIEVEWYALGLLPAERQQALESRFQRALAAQRV